MKDILFVKKSIKKGLETGKVISVFESTEDLERIKKAVENANERIYTTWASVETRDNDNEIIPIEEIIKQQEILLKRNGPITDEHSNKVVGQTLAYKVLEHPETGKIGVMHLNKIFNDHEIDDKVWKEIQSGERRGSSVGGYNLNERYASDPDSGTMTRYLTDFRQLETATVHNPCNPLALNEAVSVVAKSNTVKKPFAGFKDFEDCVAQNKDKDNPQAYCATIMRATEKIENLKNKTLRQIFPEMDETFIEQFNLLLKGYKKENVLNKNPDDCNKDKSHEVEKMDEELKKTLNSISEKLEKHSKLIEKLSKQEMPEEEEKPEDEEEEVTEQDEEPEDKPQEDDKKKIKKEDATDEVEGVTGEEKPESPEPDDPNDEDAFKSELKQLKKTNEEILRKMEKLTKSTTPRVGSGGGVTKGMVNKVNDFALNMAKSNRRVNIHDVVKTLHDAGIDTNTGGL